MFGIVQCILQDTFTRFSLTIKGVVLDSSFKNEDIQIPSYNLCIVATLLYHTGHENTINRAKQHHIRYNRGER